MTEIPAAPADAGESLVAVLRGACRPRDLAAATWDPLIRQARSLNLLGRLAAVLDDRHRLAEVPERPRAHLVAARIVAEKHARDVRWEVQCIRKSLAETWVPIILLKGAAYCVADLPPARGRVFTDVDIMVPKERLDDVEKALLRDGWIFGKTTVYDQRYYRTWMHQLPPLMHFRRGTLIDVHHTIVPETARAAVTGRTLIDAAIGVPGTTDLYVLAPADMVLHSAVHLFNEGEFGNGLRDLFDLDALLTHFGSDPGFAATLVARANELGLTRPLGYALRHLDSILGRAIGEPALRAAVHSVEDLPGRIAASLMTRVLRPPRHGRSDLATMAAHFGLYVRGHALRMPLRLLVPHLLRKTFRRASEA